MTTLVIHPTDPSTDFLSDIYMYQKDWSVIRETMPIVKLKANIQSHNRIIMIGHGTEEGLLAKSEGMEYVIDSTFASILKKKKCIFIWCNADMFVLQNELKGFNTGMIITEATEAISYCVKATDCEVEISNIILVKSIRDSIDKRYMVKEVKNKYKILECNPVVKFNLNHLYD